MIVNLCSRVSELPKYKSLHLCSPVMVGLIEGSDNSVLTYLEINTVKKDWELARRLGGKGQPW